MTVSSTIQMGNDEFILYIRKKKSKCSLTNDQLGKMIWHWLEENAGGEIVNSNENCHWAISEDKNGALKLPKTAAQIKFNRVQLPQLYNELDRLASK